MTIRNLPLRTPQPLVPGIRLRHQAPGQAAASDLARNVRWREFMRKLARPDGPDFAADSRILIVNRITRITDYLFGILYVLLLVRLVLEFIGARRTSAFFSSVCGVTAPFYAPFKFIVASSSIDGAPVVWPLVIAVLGYALLHMGLRGLLRLVERG